MRQKLACFLSVLLALLLLIWLGSGASLRWYAQMVEYYTDGMVRIEHLQGNPLWALHADKIIVKDVDVVVSIYQPTLTWQVWWLLMGRVHIETASVDRLDIDMLDIETPTTFSLSDLNFLRFFEAETLELQQLNYRDGKTQVMLNQLSGQDISFGRLISGHVFGRWGERYVQFHLDGGHQQWESELHILNQQDTELLLEVRGFAWKQGVLQAEGLHELNVTGRWSHDGEKWQLEADSTIRQEKVGLNAQWLLQANPVVDHYKLDVTGNVLADWLSQSSWGFLVQGRWDDQQHQLRVEDRQQKGNWLQCEGDSLGLILTLHTDRWLLPLKRMDGWISSDAIFKVDVEKETWHANFQVHNSELASLPLQFKGQVNGTKQAWQIDHLTASMLGLAIDIQGGHHDQVLALQVQAESDDLKKAFHLFGVNANAILKANMDIHGTMDTPLVDWDVLITDFVYADFALRKMQWHGHAKPLSWLGDMYLQLEGMTLGTQYQWSFFDVQLKKTVDDMHVLSRAQGDLGWVLDIQGEEDRFGWKGEFKKGVFQFRGKDFLHVQPITWYWKKGAFYLDQGKLWLQQQLGTWMVQANERGFQFQLDVAQVNLAELSHALPEWVVSGKPTSLHTSVRGTWLKPKVSVRMESEQWQVSYPQEKVKFTFKEPNIHVLYQDGAWQWLVQTVLHEQDKIHVQGHIPWQLSLYPWRNQESTQHIKDQTDIHIQVKDLQAWQSLLFPDQEITGMGDIESQIQVVDVFGDSIWKGDVRADVRHLKIPDLDLELQAKGEASWHNNQGTLNVVLNHEKGEAILHGDGVWPLQQSTFDLTLKQFPLLKLQDNSAIVDGQLTLRMDEKEQWYISGQVLAKKMLISFPDALPEASEDILWDVVTQKDSLDQALESGHLDINVFLAKDAQIVGDGMRLGLHGNLHVGGTVANPTLTGDLLVHDGVFHFRHVMLKIQPNSHIIFTGNLSEPTLNIRVAKKQTDMVLGVQKDILLGVHISGSLDEMQSVFYSDPAMSQAEILAYIATGKSLGNMEGNDLSVVANVASFFLSSNGNVLTKVHDVLQQAFGLDSLHWEVTPTGGRVVAGKKITQHMNVEVAQSLQAGASTALTLEYILMHGLAVFARQVSNQAPIFGLRYRKVWGGSGDKKSLEKQ